MKMILDLNNQGTKINKEVQLTPKENTGACLFTEVKPCWMGLISGWVIIQHSGCAGHQALL